MLDYNRLFLGKKCNNDCRFCDVKDDPCEEKSFEDIKKEIKKYENPENIYLFGGEPTIRKDLHDIIDELKDNGAKRIKLLTNGRALGNVSYLNELLKKGVYHYEIKLNGPNPNIHEMITQEKGGYYETVQGLDNLKRTRIPNSTKKPFVAVRISLSDINKDFIIPTITFAFAFNIDRLIISHDDVAFPYSYSQGLLKSVAEICLFNRTWLRIEKVPFCILADYEYHLIELFKKEKEGYVETIACKTCVYRGICPGIQKSYIESIGPVEFKSVSKSKIVKDLKELYVEKD